MELFALLVFMLCGALIVYNHVIYPRVALFLSRKLAKEPNAAVADNATFGHHAMQWPSITIYMPAFNEAADIANKLRNLNCIDYPEGRWHVELLCDGCTDETAEIAIETLLEPWCSDLPLQLVNHQENRGKLAVINEALQRCTSDIAVLTDVSALISCDALKLIALHFANPEVGVVNSEYSILSEGHGSETNYWQYQKKLIKAESSLHSCIGCHGALYAIRAKLFTPLPHDTINDDFILPMQILQKGYKARYDDRIRSVELERASLTQDLNRRRRIGAGNFQQSIRLLPLLRPKYGFLAFNFFSGKFLRGFMPFIFLMLLISNMALYFLTTPDMSLHRIYGLVLVLQIAAYGLVMLQQFANPKSSPRWLRILHYILAGYANALIGSLRYILHLDGKRWHKITSTEGFKNVH